MVDGAIGQHVINLVAGVNNTDNAIVPNQNIMENNVQAPQAEPAIPKPVLHMVGGDNGANVQKNATGAFNIALAIILRLSAEEIRVKVFLVNHVIHNPAQLALKIVKIKLKMEQIAVFVKNGMD